MQIDELAQLDELTKLDELTNNDKVLQAEENVRMIRDVLRLARKKSDRYMHNGMVLSIHLQSNRPGNFIKLLDNLEATADDFSSFEVIVKIDDTSHEMNSCLAKEIARRPFRIKYIATPLLGGFFALWSSMNDILRIADPNVYFFVNFNDEMYFKTKGWDSILKKYIALFPDHVYRLRTSFFRFRNYIDKWECGFAPETSAITTRKWIELGGNWNPCLGPDSFQQCVSYYFDYHERFYRDRYVRDIPINDISIGGEGAGIGLKGEDLERWFGGAVKSWYNLMSYKIQTEASRRGRKLYAYVWAKDHDMDNFELIDDTKKQIIYLKSSDNAITYKMFSYKISRLYNLYMNVVRFFAYYNYGGGGHEVRISKKNIFKKMLAYRFKFHEKIKSVLKRSKTPTQAILTKSNIKLSIAWPTYMSPELINPLFFSPEFINLLSKYLNKDSIHLLDAEIHPGYVVLRLISPLTLSILEIVKKLRQKARIIHKDYDKNGNGNNSKYWVNLLMQDDFYLYKDPKTEENALKSWRDLALSSAEPEVIKP